MTNPTAILLALLAGVVFIFALRPEHHRPAFPAPAARLAPAEAAPAAGPVTLAREPAPAAAPELRLGPPPETRLSAAGAEPPPLTILPRPKPRISGHRPAAPKHHVAPPITVAHHQAPPPVLVWPWGCTDGQKAVPCP